MWLIKKIVMKLSNPMGFIYYLWIYYKCTSVIRLQMNHFVFIFFFDFFIVFIIIIIIFTLIYDYEIFFLIMINRKTNL